MLSFIHAGDVHLGNPFTGIAKNLPDKFQTAIQNAGYESFQRLIQSAVSNQVDFVLFPGDLLNGAGQSAKVQATLLRGFLALEKAGIQVLLSYGNHDYQALSDWHQTWPKNIHVFGSEVSEIRLKSRDGQLVGFTGFSYANREENRDRLADFPSRDPELPYEIGLYHGMQGKSGDRYAAFSVEQMLQKGYDYWALGHIHQRLLLHERPTIAYSGNLQGLNRKEVGAKGALLVKESSGQLVSTFLDLSVVRFEQAVVESPAHLLELVRYLQEQTFPKLTFLSIQLSGTVGSDIQAAAVNGDLLERIQQSLGANSMVWPIHVDFDKGKTVTRPAFASLSFEGAIDETVTTENLLAQLSDEVPLAVREYFSQEEGQAAVRTALNQLFELEGGDNEN
ncbi:metallophosphoesterase family protein [Fructobacillus parabroussonetiae]|uniref:DNA repair exonuclease n=1 Tax=Fructobacillus parabroussonetiae TaxID=2713174 RepID=A0ABS5QZR9_9LACO|nr:DNA repair exonuclease [Fructobacillus parabroussonetiae]MBS9337407.1 DNA repair exonuclease [Fructobacillus parabroussonetiae]